MPVPAAAPPCARVVSMSTSAGSTWAAMADVLTPAGGLLDPEPEFEPGFEPDPRPEPPSKPDEPWEGMVIEGLPDALWSTACSTAPPSTPERATTTTATIEAIVQLP